MTDGGGLSHSGEPTKLVIVANWDWVLYNFRLPLATALENLGLEVILVSPEGKYSEVIRSQGFRLIDWELDRTSKNPIKELIAIWNLFQIYKQLRPMVVHHFTIKPIIYGSLAAKLIGISVVINNFTGLGFLFSNDFRARLLKLLIAPLLHWLTHARGIQSVFQNRDDFTRFSATSLNSAEVEIIIEGTGVDLEKFKPSHEKTSPPVVLMAARLLYDKGLREFVQAADNLAAKGVEVQFWLAGEQDPANPSNVADKELADWRARGTVKFLGHRTDMSELMGEATLATLPSYHEGVPLFLLEAAASGLPLVGSNIEGCRLVIKEGVNGFLVPKGDAMSLTDAVQHLIEDPALCSKMGQESRRIAESRFGQDAIHQKYQSLYVKLGILKTRNE